ncbi:OTU domain-containing protein [Cladorrhinum sp. PSN259]|nr:OTU domain-containing protein [Cladorrhinum sp. PSN259]
MEETLEQLQARHSKERKDLQSRITQKKKNATKKTRKAVNDECAQLEKELKERQELELRKASGENVEENNLEVEGEAEPEPESVAHELSDKLKSTIIAPPQPEDQPQGAGNGGGGGKKRNRQKERLARRAAEQEAAAIAAESEAANMVDHRSLEKEYMTKEFKTHSLTEKEIAPDGHCLFSAVADQLELNGIPLRSQPGMEPKIMPYKVVRAEAAEYMKQHRDDYEAFMEEGFEDYIHKIRDTAEWGGQLELSALANAYGVEIRVVQDGRTEVVSPQSPPEDKKTLWLAYYRHGYGLGEHYNSLRKDT